MTRLRLNTEYRNKIANRMRVHIEAEDTQEKEKYFQARENMKPLQDEAWNLAHSIVRRTYTEDDVKKAIAPGGSHCAQPPIHCVDQLLLPTQQDGHWIALLDLP